MDKTLSRNEILFLLVLYVIFLFLSMQFFGWIVDDLYIYFRYVNNFVNGKGIVYNSGEYVEGFSGFSWFILLSLFGYLGLPLELSAKILSLLLALLNLFLVFKISRKLNPGILSYFVCILMIFNIPFILWSASGFEIMLYIFLLLSGFYQIINLKTGTRNFSLVSVIIFLIAVTRPEGILMSLAYLVFIYIFSGDRTFSFKAAVLSGLMIVSFLIFRVIYFQDLLPNTYYAKIGQHFFGYYEMRSYKHGVLYILDFFKHNIQFIPLVILIPFTVKKLISQRSFLFIITIIFLQFFFTVFSGGDWMVQYRFIIPAIPFLSLALVICLKEFIVLKKINFTASGVIITVLTLIMIYNMVSEDKSVIKKETVMWNKLKEFSSDMKKNISSGSLVANGSSGIIPYYLEDVSFLDIVGLTNRKIAKDGVRSSAWFEKSLPAYVYANDPGWLIMWKKKNADGVYTFEDANPCYVDMARDENFKRYSLYKSYDVYDDVRVELYKNNNTPR
ncbi:MAG: hypothetical protein ABI462_02505 [Ignavibacteria bacterium]